MTKFLAIAMMLSSAAFAAKPANLPKSFNYESSQAVFVDFKTANYSIVYDGASKSASVEAVIDFESFEKGHPVFDMVTEPTSVVLDESVVSARAVRTPSNETTVRVIGSVVEAGSHKLIVKAPLSALVSFTDGGVKSAFWTSDLSERNFLERYLPANLEYDQVKMKFHIEYKNFSAKQLVYTNGVVTQNDSIVDVEYPEYYNCSAIFFHTVPAGSVSEVRFTYKSIDGRDIPGVVYVAGSNTSSLERFKNRTLIVLAELESDYGPFLHPSVTVYNAGSGGMEYHGATMTEYAALDHELIHSYFARGVMPAHGNSGWMDEAIASWRDDGYRTATTLSGSTMMSAHPYYKRTTDRNAYTFGSRFMSYLDGKFKAQGGLKSYLRHMVDKKALNPLSIEEFISEMENHYGSKSVRDDFKKYTFGSSNNFSASKRTHPVHRKMTLDELYKNL